MSAFKRNDGTTVTTDIPEIVERLREDPGHTELDAAYNAHREAQHAALHALNAWYDARQGDRHPAEAALRQAVRALRRARHASALAS